MTTEIEYDLRHAVDVANNIARQCGHKFHIWVEVKYIVEFPDQDFRQFDTQVDAANAIETFSVDIASKEAHRRLGIPEDGDDNNFRLETEMDLIMERAQ